MITSTIILVISFPLLLSLELLYDLYTRTGEYEFKDTCANLLAGLISTGFGIVFGNTSKLTVTLGYFL